MCRSSLSEQHTEIRRKHQLANGGLKPCNSNGGGAKPRVAISPEKAPAARLQSSTVLVKSAGGHFTKKEPAAIRLAAIGLVKSADGNIFQKKKPATSWLAAATGLVKSMDGHFHQKSACGKLDSSNRACQIPGWSFSSEKKRLRQDYQAAQGLSGAGQSCGLVQKSSNLVRTGSRINSLP